MKNCICKKCGTSFVRQQSARGIYCSVACAADTNKRHGLTETPEYQVWVNMRSRCLRKSDPAFRMYGARQDQRTMSPAMAMEIVAQNLEHGNLDVIKQLTNSKGGSA